MGTISRVRLTMHERIIRVLEKYQKDVVQPQLAMKDSEIALWREKANQATARAALATQQRNAAFKELGWKPPDDAEAFEIHVPGGRDLSQAFLARLHL